MSEEPRFEAVHVEATPARALDERRAAQLELLDQDEIIELSIRPSLWFVPIVAARISALIVAAALALALLVRGGPQFVSYVVSLAVLGVLARVLIASLQWASRVYVLTNRRVMRLSGVVTIDIADCRLTRISRTNLHLTSVQRMLGLGSIHMAPDTAQGHTLIWEHVARAGEVYAKVIRAIKRAQSKPH